MAPGAPPLSRVGRPTPQGSARAQGGDGGPRGRSPHYDCGPLLAELLADCRVVLDLGSGSGTVGRSLTAPRRRLVAVDISAARIAAARDADVDRIAADGRGHLPLADASFDGILMCHILEHFSPAERPAVLAEVSRVLTPGGKLVVVVPNDGISYHDFLYLNHELARADPDHRSFFTPRTLRGALESHFRVERLFTYPAPFLWLASRGLARRFAFGLGYNIYAICRSPGTAGGAVSKEGPISLAVESSGKGPRG